MSCSICSCGTRPSRCTRVAQRRIARDPRFDRRQQRRRSEAAPELQVRQIARGARDALEHRQRILVAVEMADPEHRGIAVQPGRGARGGRVARARTSSSIRESRRRRRRGGSSRARRNGSACARAQNDTPSTAAAPRRQAPRRQKRGTRSAWSCSRIGDARRELAQREHLAREAEAMHVQRRRARDRAAARGTRALRVSGAPAASGAMK